jgi:hypothetical protein
MFLQKLYLNTEILGYSRAIGAMLSHPGVTAAHMEGLYQGREAAVKKLAELKATQKVERASKTFNERAA